LPGEGRDDIGKQYAIVICAAATAVIALGAQTEAQTQAPTPRGQTTPTCDGKPATIVGTSGRDDLKGTPGPDVIVGLGGNDINIKGLGGNDVICGGKGWDFLWGSWGKDTLLGQAGRDAFDGGDGNDRCEGGEGKDSGDLRPGDPDCEVKKSIEVLGWMPGIFH
jgi:Ca2+-binding RTX toxin-like protein